MVDEVTAHKVNITYISMCSYRLLSDGSFGYQSSSTVPTGQIMEEWSIKLQSLGFPQIPLIDCASTEAAQTMLATDSTQQQFINAALTKALSLGFKGYNLDWEVDADSDVGLQYMQFVAKFAATLHQHNMTLSADIAGYCPPWYMGVTCDQLATSAFDKLYTMDTYQSNPANFQEYVQDSVKIFGVKAATGFSNSQDPDNMDSHSQMDFVKDSGIEDIAVWCLTDGWGMNS
eukprot:CAMPEP_0197042980 /NCGR_PEP_ID=MMETSP1384-20130603/19282_1 /TAXON_ID=29189 /ORGANISM="Ammonia sp." /LENGTH=230 /DNA_ID=CAMNT_0042474195 /DNA_START=100 /DNA_END=788 /DNA_ORIENTATION=-